MYMHTSTVTVVMSPSIPRWTVRCASPTWFRRQFGLSTVFQPLENHGFTLKMVLWSAFIVSSTNMPARYQDGDAGSHGFGPTYSTCLQVIRTRLQDLTGLEHQIEHAYEVSGRAAGYHRLGTADRTSLRGIRTGLQDLTCLEQQIQHAYEVLRMGL